MSETRSERLTPSMRELFEPAKLELDRAPVLRGVFDRFAAGCGEILRPICMPQCTFMLNAISAGATWDFIEEYENGICAIYDSPEWEARIVIGFDRRFVFSFTDAIFGGDGTEAPYEGDRSFSAVEIGISKEILELATRHLTQLFNDIDRMSLSFERIETKPEFSSIGLPDAPAVIAKVVAQVYDGGGQIFIIIPQSALIPLRRKLERERMPEPTQSDPVWSKQLMTEIGQADVELTAILDGPALALGEILTFKAGDIMRLPATVDGLLSLESEDQPLFQCRLGQSQGQFTVQIAEHFDHFRNFLKDVAAGMAAET